MFLLKLHYEIRIPSIVPRLKTHLGQLLLLSNIHGIIKRIKDETIVQLYSSDKGKISECVKEMKKFCRAWKINSITSVKVGSFSKLPPGFQEDVLVIIEHTDTNDARIHSSGWVESFYPKEDRISSRKSDQSDKMEQSASVDLKVITLSQTKTYSSPSPIPSFTCCERGHFQEKKRFPEQKLASFREFLCRLGPEIYVVQPGVYKNVYSIKSNIFYYLNEDAMNEDGESTSPKIPINTLGDLREMVTLRRPMIFELVADDEIPERIECALLDPKVF